MHSEQGRDTKGREVKGGRKERELTEMKERKGKGEEVREEQEKRRDKTPYRYFFFPFPALTESSTKLTDR